MSTDDDSLRCRVFHCSCARTAVLWNVVAYHNELSILKPCPPAVAKVTVQEIFGAIVVDRVAVRPESTSAQEKVSRVLMRYNI